MARFKTLYGASPLHLLAVIASFALAGYGFLRITEAPNAIGTLIWFGAAVFAHDLLAFPLYSVLNLIAHRSLVKPADDWLDSRRVPAINHLRIPALLSAFMLLLFFPLIFGLASERYTDDTGQNVDVFMGRWLGICALLFVGSALIYAIRLRRAGRTRGGVEAADG